MIGDAVERSLRSPRVLLGHRLRARPDRLRGNGRKRHGNEAGRMTRKGKSISG